MIIPKVEPIISYYPHLETSEKFNPWDVLDLIFTHYTLDQIRYSLWELYTGALYDDSLNSNSKDRSDLVFLYTCLNDLATAAYVVARKRHVREQKEKASK